MTRITDRGRLPRNFGVLDQLIAAVAGSFIRQLASRAGDRLNHCSIETQFGSIVNAFLEGCNLALAQCDCDELIERLNSSSMVSPELRGFAFEGAAMSLGLLDLLTPWNRVRLETFIEHTGEQHIYMTYIGLGWALARLRRSVEGALRSADPLLGWLVVDGYGFHHGFFKPKLFVSEHKIPPKLSGYAVRVFDQGLGRSLWFLYGGDVYGIQAAILSFARHRRSDLWSGVGLAGAYAGGVERNALLLLKSLATGFKPELAQGAAFAAKARERANIPAKYTHAACEILCGMSADEAVSVVDACSKTLPSDGRLPRYEIWREAIRRRFLEC